MKDYRQILENAKGMIDEVSQQKIKGLIAGRKRQADAAADQLTNVNKAYLGVTGKPKLGTIHPKTVGTVGKAAQGDDRLIDAGNVFRKQEMIARRKQWDAEWRLKGNKGKDPRNEEVTTNEYTELLEVALFDINENPITMVDWAALFSLFTAAGVVGASTALVMSGDGADIINNIKQKFKGLLAKVKSGLKLTPQEKLEVKKEAQKLKKSITYKVAEEVTTNEYTEPVTEAKDTARAKHNAAVLRAAGGAKAYQAQKMAKRPILDREISEFVERLSAKQIILLKKLVAARIADAAALLGMKGSVYQGGNQIGNDYPGQYGNQGGNQIGNY
mgnify:CR=1 FL=1